MTNEISIDELLKTIITMVVDEPQNVKITAAKGTNTVVYEVTTADKDVGKVIGAKGSTIRAIRRIVQVVSRKRGQKSSVEVIEKK